MARNFRSSAEDLTELQRDDENERTAQFANSRIERPGLCGWTSQHTRLARRRGHFVIQALKKYAVVSK
jgi:hypothetical protein